MKRLLLFMVALISSMFEPLRNEMGTASYILPRKVTGYSEISEEVLAAESIIRQVSNLDIEGTPGFTTVSVFVHSLTTVAEYVPGTGLAMDDDTSAYVTLSNGVEIAVNEVLDGYTVATAPMDLAVKRLAAANSAIAESVDTAALVLMESGGTELVAVGGAKVDTTTVVAKILALKAALDTAKAPRKDRYLIVNVAVENILLQTAAIILNTDRGDNIQADGYIGRLYGFDIFGSPLVPTATNMMAMQKRGFAFGYNWKVEPMIKELTNAYIGDSAVQGRLAYNCGAVRATLIQVDNGRA